MRKLGLLLGLLFIMVVGAFAEGNYETVDTAETTQARETSRQMAEMQSQVGMPVIKNFFEKKQAKWIFEARDNTDLITYAYAFSDYHGKFIFISKCIGYGLPYSVQYTSPLKLIDVTDYGISSYQSNDSAVVPQADPNGLYMPDGLSATWLFMINPETNKPEPVYMEPTITVTPFPLDPRLCLGGINK